MAQDTKLIIGILALQGAFQEHLAILSRLSPLPAGGANVNIEPILVKTIPDLAQCDALILPGGESTTIALLARVSGLLEPLREFVRGGEKAVWGTCAGAILMAEHGVKKGEKEGGQELFGGVNIKVERNGWGSQVESFETPLYVDCIRESNRPFRGVFIRAPLILDLLPPVQHYGAQTAATLGSETLSRPPTHAPSLAEIHVLARLTADLLPPSSDPARPNDDDPTDPRDDRTIVALRQGKKLITTFHPELTADPRFHEYFIKECVLASHP